ncbi:uncharacterized protein [Prorops nasuta]|uniref:uncharacterized protein n=1 Tax=Prorops nasuta TaxID=863751 RepID=UPI0034CD250C
MAKLIVQECWKDKIDWDETTSLALNEKWSRFATQLPSLNDISVERYLLINEVCEIQIHGFCDASKLGYGACLYLRSENKNGNVITRLICSKSRVASLKEITIPRLELNGALTLVRLYEEIRSLMKIRINKIIFWCDSSIALHWIHKSPMELRTYEANRVTEIQRLNSSAEWRHVRTQENPTDCLSRGQDPSEFLMNKTWFNGPTWLKFNENMWPRSIQIPIHNDSGQRTEACFLVKDNDNDIFKRSSSYSRLLKIVAYCLRFLRSNKQRGELTKNEIEQSEFRVIQLIQAERFYSELKCLKEDKGIKIDRIAALNPFLNADGLMCVGGRLRKANIPFSQKYSILIPARHYVTDLIIREFHEKFYHAGVQTTLYFIRQRFWIPDGKNQVRKIVRSCVRCRRFSAKTIDYKMADLPTSRVEVSNPFHHTGIDFFGPMFIKEKKYRNQKRIKVYGCVFICMTTKAVHIEIVSDLSSDVFIAALRRFAGRRGVPANIYTDNGTNFNKINWHFNPPLSPHFGGIWEAAVKSFKYHYKRIVGDQLFTLEELNTFTIEIEAILNSRPLCPISSDPNDPIALTPAHLLIGRPLNMLPESDDFPMINKGMNVWRVIQKIKVDFWKRWQIEYLNELQKRTKWIHPGQGITADSVVLIIERNQPCMYWPMGRVIELHPGDDGIVRVVTVRTSREVLIAKLSTGGGCSIHIRYYRILPKFRSDIFRVSNSPCLENEASREANEDSPAIGVRPVPGEQRFFMPSGFFPQKVYDLFINNQGVPPCGVASFNLQRY